MSMKKFVKIQKMNNCYEYPKVHLQVAKKRYVMNELFDMNIILEKWNLESTIMYSISDGTLKVSLFHNNRTSFKLVKQ